MTRRLCRTLFTRAHETGRIESNPAADVRRIGGVNVGARVPIPSELRRLLAEAPYVLGAVYKKE